MTYKPSAMFTGSTVNIVKLLVSTCVTLSSSLNLSET